MEEKNEFIATCTDSMQITPDDFKIYHPTIKLTEETTIGEIKQWWNANGYKGKMEVTIIQL